MACALDVKAQLGHDVITGVRGRQNAMPCYSCDGSHDASICPTPLPGRPRTVKLVEFRNQVYEVAVRVAMTGAPWHEEFREPLNAAHIKPEEIETEARRRLVRARTN